MGQYVNMRTANFGRICFSGTKSTFSSLLGVGVQVSCGILCFATIPFYNKTEDEYDGIK
jgi:hypothetical protein